MSETERSFFRGRAGVFGAAALIFVVALAARLVVPFLGGGLHGRYDNDPAVYYAAADAMLSGLAPYRDFYLVHPPLLPLLLTPFAALGRATTDHTGFAVGNLAFTALGAGNAVLTFLLARAIGMKQRAAVLGGLFYATWIGAVTAEFDMRLEPLGNTFFLLGLLMLARSRSAKTARTALLAGFVLGLSIDVKIWWVLPLLVVAVDLVVRRRFRDLSAAVVGAVAAVAAVFVPFSIIAGSKMWFMVVESQVGRYRSNGSLVQRVRGMAVVVPGAWRDAGHLDAIVVVSVLLLLGLAALSWRFRPARLYVALLVVQIVALFAISSYYSYYDDWLVVSLALVVASAADVGGPQRFLAAKTFRPIPSYAFLGLTVAIVAFVLAESGTAFVVPFPHRARLARTVVRYGGCMQANSPTLLVEADALTRSFSPPCHDVVDVTSPAVGSAGPRFRLHPGYFNPYYDGYLARYLTSGGTAMLTVKTGYGLSVTGLRAVTCGGVVAKAGGFDLYRTGRCSHRLAAQLPG